MTTDGSHEADKSLAPRQMHALRQAIEHNPNPAFPSVDHDGLRLRYTTDPVPIAVIQCAVPEIA